MRSRQTLVDLFSTFVRFDADTFSGWISDPKLRRSMDQLIKQATEGTSEGFWILYWHKVWQTQTTDLATNHMTAYLQEACYWVARKMALNLAGRQSTADLFQTAIARTRHVLKGFNPQFSSNLKSYAEFAFSNVIKDALRQQQETDICTDWALLQKVSQKRLVDALTHAGIDTQKIAAYGLAWKCFKHQYAPNNSGTSRKLVRPDGVTWQAIAQTYNAERTSQLISGSACSPDQLEQWLLTAARSVRFFLYSTPISIDAPLPGHEHTGLVDLLPNAEQESLLGILIAQEEVSDRQMQQTQLSQVILDAIAQLEAPMQRLLQAYYGQQMTQQQIAQLLNMPQYTISRRLASLKKTLLKALACWSQDTLHISVTSDVLSSMSAVLEEWLTVHYQPADPS